MKKLLALALPLALASCSTMNMPGGGTSYTLGKQPAAGTLSPSGTVIVKMTGNTVLTEATVKGLKANQVYVAHYHLQGTASTDPCSSNGPAIMSSMVTGQTDANGTLVLARSVPSSVVMSATYFNIHTAADANGTPADAGVACTAVKMGTM